jgi:alpha(1,3/1,4) fucosyltransferase
MNKLKVAFLDFWPEIKDENIFLPILQKSFEVEVTKNDPDVVIHSVFGGMKETPRYKCKKILFLGENHRPKNFQTDYSISFDPHSETNFRLPLWQFYLILRPELKDKLFNRSNNRDSFDRFCSFTVSNSNNFFRNGFYDQLSFYKRIHSYGRYNTNDMGLIQASQGKYWRDAKYDFFLKRSHKFSIAFENSSYPGYTTEKLMDAFLAGSLPIYWGDIKVHEDFNSAAFVGAMCKCNVIEMVKTIDSDDVLFKEKYESPVFTEEQKNKHIQNMDAFEKWLISVCVK